MSAQDTASSELRPLVQGSTEGINAPNAATATAEQASISMGVAEGEEARESAFTALRHRDFRLLWAGNFISQVGTQMQIVAVGVQLWDLTQDPVLLGLRGLFKLLPVILLSLFGGVIADALNRRKLMIITQSCMAATSGLLAVSTIFGWVSPGLIYLLTIVAAAAVAFDNPARTALVPNLVPRKHLPNALSLSIIVSQVATIVGPMVAGLLLPIHATGFAIIYVIDVISFMAVITALVLMHARGQAAETRNVSLRAAVEGLRFLRRTPIIMSTMTLDFFATFFGAATILIPAFGERVLHVDRELWGLLYAAPAVGAVVAGVVMSWLGNVRHQGWIVIFSVMAYGVATVFFGVSNFYLLTLLALAGTGAADTVSMVMRQTIRQLSTPDELRGRMTSVNMIFYMGGPQLGEFEAGIAAQLIGLGPSVMLGGVAVIIVTAVTGLLVPSLRAYDRNT